MSERMKYTMKRLDPTKDWDLTLFRYDVPANGTTDNAHREFWHEIEALREENRRLTAALRTLSRYGPIMGSRDEYRRGQTEVLEYIHEISREALQPATPTRDDTQRLRDALQTYAECSDGCTCGDGWSHDAAIEALQATR